MELAKKEKLEFNILNAKKNGFYNLTRIKDNNGEYVPDVKFGLMAHTNDLRRRVQLAETLNNLIDEILILKKAVYHSIPTDEYYNELLLNYYAKK